MDPSALIELALRAGASEADVYAVESEEAPVGFEANRLKSLETKQSRGFGLRVIKDGRLGVASATDLSNPHFLVEAACEVAAFGATAAFHLPAPAEVATIPVYDPAVEAIPVDAMVAMGQSLIDHVRAFNPEVLCEATVTRNRARIRVITSSGIDVAYDKSVHAVSLAGTLIRGTDMLFVGESEVSCHPVTDTNWIVAETIEQLRRAERIATIASGTYPVLMTPHGIAYALMGPLLAAFNGRTVLQGASPIGSKLGERVLDDRLTIWDDPSQPFRPASAPIDDEGVAARRRALVAHGTIAGFVYDLQTAGLAGVPPTGNGARSPGSLPSPAVHGLVIEPGSGSTEELIRSIDEGLVVELVIGAGQGNVLGGDFGGNVVLGYKVERGEIVGRVKDTMIAGNVGEALQRIGAIGGDTRWVGGSLQTPPLLLERLSVSSRGGA